MLRTATPVLGGQPWARRSRRLFALVAAVSSLVAPSVAQADTVTWATDLYAGPGQSFYSYQLVLLAGVYCHELDDGLKNIEVNAVTASKNLYGSWVSYQTDGYRSYAGQSNLYGACRNPHTVGYRFNAHDNYFI